MKKPKTIEDICIQKITRGINSLKNGFRSPVDIESDLDFCFNKLEKLNKGMYQELYLKYCIVRLEKEKEIKESV